MTTSKNPLKEELFQNCFLDLVESTMLLEFQTNVQFTENNNYLIIYSIHFC